jgi:hypothetical protein
MQYLRSSNQCLVLRRDSCFEEARTTTFRTMNSSTLEVLYEAKSFTQSASSRFQFLEFTRNMIGNLDAIHAKTRSVELQYLCVIATHTSSTGK